jgi:hypothetical protein
MSAAGALQRAVFEALSADAALTALIGQGRVFDRQLAGQRLPHVVLAESSATDWSTSSETGEQHALTIDVWSDRDGKHECQVIAAAVKTVLHDQPLTLAGAHLINLRVLTVRFERETRERRHRARLQLRAVTEPA